MPGYNSPNSIPGQQAASKEHSNIHGRGLDDCSDGDNNTRHLHKAKSTEFISDCSLSERADCFASDVH